MTRAAPPAVFLSHAHIRNYKSLADVAVNLDPLTVLVGLNASGKSNFLDALRFVKDATTGGLTEAVSGRGGVRSLWHRRSSAVNPGELMIDLHLRLASPPPRRADGSPSTGRPVRYGFALEVEAGDEGEWAPVVAREWCESEASGASFTMERGRLVNGPEELLGPVADPYNLLLPALARWRKPFARIHHAVTAMSFHLMSPSVMRRVEPRSPHTALGPSGERLGEVLGQLTRRFPTVKSRIDDYLAAVVPGAIGVDEYRLPEHSTVRLRARDPLTEDILDFGPESISDGTLSAAGLLAALFQPAAMTGEIPLIGIEEPELGLHPTAAGVLFDALTEAAEHVQVIAATQSGDLLDREDFAVDWARVVQFVDGVTTIGEVDEGSRAVMAQGLATLGELMRSTNSLPDRPPSTSRDSRHDRSAGRHDRGGRG